MIVTILYIEAGHLIILLFLHPFYALCWMRWMAWKDLLLHLWVGSELNPLWHSCVGHAIVRRDDLKNMSKFDNKWGDVSTFSSKI